MKIGNSIDAVKTEGVGPAGAGRPGVSSSRPVAPTEGSDRIDLSETSRTLAGGEARTSAEIRADKVAEVREAIARGEYRVDAHVVAERLIIETAQLLETLSSGGKGVGGAK
jgi:flagellar biosynthesis anti-sigma factor FlgM